MKKITAILLGTLLASSAALAQTNQVLSRNAVGYVKIEMRTNSLNLIRNDFVGLTGPIAVSNTFNVLPNGSQVILWDKSLQTWKPGIVKTFTGWGGGGTNVLARGDAFFVRLPATAASNVYTVFIMGEVPDRFTAPTTTLSAVAGLNAAGYPYPANELWTNTPIAKFLPNGSTIITWNPTNQTYNPAIVKTFTGWGAGNSLVLKPGEGFFVNAAVSQAPTNYTIVKPYTWP